MSKRILVTGGAGFIGSHLVDRLIQIGHKVRIVDNLEAQVHSARPDYLNPEAEFIEADILNPSAMAKALKNIDVVFHQAAVVGVGQSMYQIRKYTDVNCSGTAQILDTIVNGNYEIEKLIVASSMSIYGEGAYSCGHCGQVYPKTRTETQLKSGMWEILCPNCGCTVKSLPTDEEKTLQPTSVYAVSKRDQEEMCLSVASAYKLPMVALRYFNTYGPRQSLANPYTGVAAIFLSRIKNGNPPLIFEDGNQMRDFVSVHDIVQANILAMEKQEADYQTFNVGSGHPVTIKQIADILLNIYKSDLHPEILGKYRAGDIRHCYGDISKISKLLGFSPNISLNHGMIELAKWSESVKAEDKSVEAQAELEKRKLFG